MKRFLIAALTVAAMLVSSPNAAHAVSVFTVSLYSTCANSGVRVTNNSGADAEIRVYLDGNPLYSGNPWTTVANGSNKLFSGLAPSSGTGTYTTYKKGAGGAEELLATTVYTTPSYCTAFDVTYIDTCDKVKVTVTNNYGVDADFTISQTSGATYPIATLAVPAGQTASVDIVITSVIYRIGLYLKAVGDKSIGDYIDQYTPKGLGNCPTPDPTPTAGEPDPTPTTEPTPTADEPNPTPTDGSQPSTSPSSPGLPVTGGNLVLFLVAGMMLVLFGGATLYVARRRQLSA